MFDKQANKKLYNCYKNIQSMGTYIFQIYEKKIYFTLMFENKS